MQYYCVECEAPGGGYGTSAKLVYDLNVQYIERVDYLDLIFDVWLGGELVQHVGCFCVTEKLWNFLNRSGISGVSARSMKVTPGDYVNDLHPGREIPSFKELILERGFRATNDGRWRLEKNSIPEVDMFTGFGLPLFVTDYGRELLLRYGVIGVQINEAIVT